MEGRKKSDREFVRACSYCEAHYVDDRWKPVNVKRDVLMSIMGSHEDREGHKYELTHGICEPCYGDVLKEINELRIREMVGEEYYFAC